MMGKDLERKGGLGKDPEVGKFQKKSAVNVAALSNRERAELERIRVRYDVPEWLKASVEEAARQEDTSASQMGAFLLAWGLMLYQQGDGELVDMLRDSKEPSRSLRIAWNVGIPRKLKKEASGAK